MSIGAQTFHTRLLRVLERRAGPDDVRRAFHHLRDAGLDNLSLDLLYGSPARTPQTSNATWKRPSPSARSTCPATRLGAKPGTRFAHTFGAELARQGEAMEGYFERVVQTLTTAGYRCYETANCLRADLAGPHESLRAQHNLGYWLGRDYLGPRDRRRLGRRGVSGS